MPFKDKEKQRAAQRAYQARRKAALAAAGLCSWCRQPSPERLCAQCVQRHRATNKAWRQRRYAEAPQLGRCRLCFKLNDAPSLNKHLCSTCRAKEIVRRRKGAARLIEERLEANLCIRCGKTPLLGFEAGFKCLFCSDKEAIRKRRAYQRRQAAKGKGYKPSPKGRRFR
jgi:hypothetical protein